MTEIFLKIYKTIKISSIIFKPENLKEIAQILEKEYESDVQKDLGMPIINYTFTTKDGTQYDGDFLSLFNGSFLNTKPITKITMSYSNYRLNKEISINLEESSSFFASRSKCNIKGTDEQWVNGLKTTLEEMLNSFEKRNIIARAIYKHDLISVILTMGVLNFWLQGMFRSQISELMKDSKTYSSAAVLFMALSCVSLTIYYALYKIFKLMFPEIEFNVGQEHHQTQKIIRKACYFLIFILIPAILAIIGSWPVIMTHLNK